MGKENTERGEGRCGLKSLWAFKRLLPYCFETVQSDIRRVAQRTADHTEAAIKTPTLNSAGAPPKRCGGKCRSKVEKPLTVHLCSRCRGCLLVCKLLLIPYQGHRRCWKAGQHPGQVTSPPRDAHAQAAAV